MIHNIWRFRVHSGRQHCVVKHGHYGGDAHSVFTHSNFDGESTNVFLNCRRNLLELVCLWNFDVKGLQMRRALLPSLLLLILSKLEAGLKFESCFLWKTSERKCFSIQHQTLTKLHPNSMLGKGHLLQLIAIQSCWVDMSRKQFRRRPGPNWGQQLGRMDFDQIRKWFCCCQWQVVAWARLHTSLNRYFPFSVLSIIVTAPTYNSLIVIFSCVIQLLLTTISVMPIFSFYLIIPLIPYLLKVPPHQHQVMVNQIFIHPGHQNPTISQVKNYSQPFSACLGNIMTILVGILLHVQEQVRRDKKQRKQLQIGSI